MIRIIVAYAARKERTAMYHVMIWIYMFTQKNAQTIAQKQKRIEEKQDE